MYYLYIITQNKKQDQEICKLYYLKMEVKFLNDFPEVELKWIIDTNKKKTETIRAIVFHSTREYHSTSILDYQNKPEYKTPRVPFS